MLDAIATGEDGDNAGSKLQRRIRPLELASLGNNGHAIADVKIGIAFRFVCNRRISFSEWRIQDWWCP
jgi:hypothetical protein